MSNANEQGATPTNAETPTATVTTPPVQAPVSTQEPADTFVSKSELDSANSRIKTLNNENKNYRLLSETLKNMGLEPEALRGLLETQKTELETYRVFGKPDELKTKLESGQNAITERDNLQRDSIISNDLKLKPSPLLSLLLKDVKLTAEGEGEARKVFALSGDDKKPWDDYVKSRAELAEALPAIKGEEKSQSATWVQQPSGNEGKAPTHSESARVAQAQSVTRQF